MFHNATEALVGDGLLTVPEAIAFLRLSRSTLYALMDAGRTRVRSDRPRPPDPEAGCH